MRRTRFAALAPLVLTLSLLAACGDDDEPGASASGSIAESTSTAASESVSEPAASETPEPTPSAACAEGKTLEDGMLTAATSEPAFPPYVIDDDPTNQKGFESAVLYAVAREMGFAPEQVSWVRTTFDAAIQPGPKDFDVNLQQYSISPEREENVAFSDPYFVSNQALVGLAGSAAEGATTVADLKDLKLGAQAATTSLQFIQDVIQPTSDPYVYDDNVAAKAALEADQVDAIVVDLPTAFYITAVEIEGSSVVGQFPASAGGTTDEFGMVLEKDNPLVDCVNEALTTLTDSGELDKITTKWMSAKVDAPIISVE